MGKYTDIAQRVREQQEAAGALDGHVVTEVIWHTDRMIIFKDNEGNLWRRVHAWGITWPVSVRRPQ